MEKVMECHGISKAQKSTNPVNVTINSRIECRHVAC